MVGLERDDEVLVVEAEGVRGVDAYAGILVADLDVGVHHGLALLQRQEVPLAALHEGVDEQVLRPDGANLQPRPLLALVAVAVDVLRLARHRQEGVRHREVAAHAGGVNARRKGLQVFQVERDRPQEEVGVGARAGDHVGPDHHPVGKLADDGGDLALALRLRFGVQTPPLRRHPVEGVFHGIGVRLQPAIDSPSIRDRAAPC